jgi:FixJ family two-component response regulator
MALHFTLADDDHDYLFFLERLLKTEFPGCTITAFQCPREALEHIHKIGTDVLVTNHGMGPMSGTQLITLLRREGFTEPIIMISNHPAIESEALGAGANQFLDKAHLSRLPTVIRSLLPKNYRQ